MRHLLRIATLAFFSVSAYAQSVAGFGAITGSVRDASGANIPDAEVVVSNESKGIQRTLRTNDAGLFAAGSLVPDANYRLVITRPGFTSYEARNIEVLVGQ